MTAGRVLHVCTSPDKHAAKRAVPQALFRTDHGLDADAHAGPGHRQVSLLDEADIETMRADRLDLPAGAFGENVVVRGIAMAELGIGTRLRVGEAEIEITQIGKVCHNRCAVYARAGDCIMPRAGLFARVTRDGIVRPGDAIEVTMHVPRDATQAAVLTVSDRCAAGEAEDRSGPAVVTALRDALHTHIAWQGVRPDVQETLEATLRDLASRGLDLVVTVGGTGCGPRDATPEATRAVIQREVPGLAEAMRAASAIVTPHAWLQRGLCGIRNATLIINLPGSPNAARENLAAIQPALPHAINLLRGHTRHE